MADRPKPRPKAKPAARKPAANPARPAADSPAATVPEKNPAAEAAVVVAEIVEAETANESVVAQPVASDDGPFDESANGGSFLLFTAMPSWLASMIVHIVVILALALYALPAMVQPKPKELILGDNNDIEETFEEFQDEKIDTSELDVTEMSEVVMETEMIAEDPIFTEATDLTATALRIETDPLGAISVMSTDIGKAIGVSGGEGLDGRGTASRAQLVKEGGGTPGSEAAVAAALKWIKEHQLADGGWHLDHKLSPQCQGRCKNPGQKAPCRFGATGLALLPFLGAGQTHKEGEYKYIVDRGLNFLVRNIKMKNRNGVPCGRLHDEGNYYSHGLCAIALCEAYAMTGDKRLAAPAQALLNETVMAQDPVGGGWRYSYQQPGDTSALGWQLMALKSGHMAYLNVPKGTIVGATKFLDSVQSKDGANYGYTDPSENWRNSMAAVGMLCRMYLGWKKENSAIQVGVNHLSEIGPSDHDIYYNYYATQVMHHYGGEAWTKWNDVMRDQLVNSQDKKGHQAGSWIYDGGHANGAGGRLYATSLSTMILEVYYRHMPIYKSKAAEDDFPL